jgi:hypothetical protein
MFWGVVGSDGFMHQKTTRCYEPDKNFKLRISAIIIGSDEMYFYGSFGKVYFTTLTSVSRLLFAGYIMTLSLLRLHRAS